VAKRPLASLLIAVQAVVTTVLVATADAATITVNSLADTGAPGICVLRDAITAANTMTATNGCAAGSGNDTIQFSISGTIFTTQSEVTDPLLTINGPIARPGITIDGGGNNGLMFVSGGATLNLNHLIIAHGSQAIINEGTLTVTNCTLSGNNNNGGTGVAQGGAIFNFSGTLTVTNSTFSDNTAIGELGGFGGGTENQGTLTVTQQHLLRQHRQLRRRSH
jgi:hypothetical protein